MEPTALKNGSITAALCAACRNEAKLNAACPQISWPCNVHRLMRMHGRTVGLCKITCRHERALCALCFSCTSRRRLRASLRRLRASLRRPRRPVGLLYYTDSSTSEVSAMFLLIHAKSLLARSTGCVTWRMRRKSVSFSYTCVKMSPLFLMSAH